MSKTREDVERLKKQWDADPCFDLADTEGFEEYHNELVAHENMRGAQWSEEHGERVREVIVRYGQGYSRDNAVRFGEAILKLEERVKKLEKRLNEKDDGIAGLRMELQALRRVLGVGDAGLP